MTRIHPGGTGAAVMQGFFPGGRLDFAALQATAVRHGGRGDSFGLPRPAPSSMASHVAAAVLGRAVQARNSPLRPILHNDEILARSGPAVRLPDGLLDRIPGGAGRPLPPALQGRMEDALGGDFAAVRIHLSPAPLAIGALAFTKGTDIHFAPGRFDPVTVHGRRLIAHELAHVLQQRAGRVRNPFDGGLAIVQDPGLEAEAERLAHRQALWQVQPSRCPTAALQPADEERKWYGKPLKSGKEYPNALLDRKLLKDLDAEGGYSKEYDRKHNVRYLTREEKKPLKVRGKPGALSTQAGPLENGTYMYAVSPKGGLYVWRSALLSIEESFQHSSFFRGERIQAAGYLDVNKGRIENLDAGSGHYKPSDEQLINTALGLLAAGLVDDEVTLTGGGSSPLQGEKLYVYSDLDERTFSGSLQEL